MFKHIKGPFSKKKKPAKKHPETLRYEELEQRVLFSADIAPGLDTLAVEEQVLVENVTADMAAEQEAAEQSVEQKPAETRRELVFVNENVDGYDQLIADLQGNNDNRIIEVVAIESDRNGIEQVSEILSERSDLAAVHVISHGADGQINLGDSWLNANSLEKNSDAVAGWGNALTETGDILFYGCNLAETEAGQSLINKLSKLTLAEVAASVNLTGDVNKEGDWQLEFVTGRVESDVVLSTEMQQEYQYTLSTYTVSSLADSGPGSIRQAIIDANANGGADIIEFNVAGTVNLLTELPDINSQISIDGSTAPGYAGEPLVILDGSAVGSANGLTFAAGADGSSVHGLAIIDFTGNGIQIDLGSDGNLITGNWIGTTGNGSTGVGNSNNGINVQGANTIIGGTGSNDGNVITNNGNEGINLTGAGATGTIIQGNIIGLDPDGSTGSGNGDVGIALLSGSHNTTIGGTTVEARNVISNNYEGIEINSNNNIVQGNYIGTDITGTLDRGNHSDDGVEIKNNATGNLIGGTDTGAGNLIAFNALDGVNIVSGSGNAVLGNDIHSNGDLDIDLGAGANNSQAAPTLATANATENQIVITGSLSSAVNDFYRIEFFSNSGGIQTYIGYVNVATDGTGNANINATLDESVAVGATIRATAINSDAGYTGFTDSSELGVGVIAVAANDAPINAVPGSQTISQDESLSFSTANGNAITISDTDAGSNEIEVTLSVDNGTLNLSDLLESQALTTVNTTEAGSQDRADLVFAPDGSFVAVWTDSSLDTGTAGVYMQRYDAAGAAIGGQVRVNSTSAGDQTSPAIAMDGSGKFVVTWASYDQDKNNTWGVYAQRFDASGNAIGGEIQVNTTTNDSQLKPDIAMTDGGEFTIIWEGKGSGDTWGIFAQQFDNSGSAVGGEIAVNTTDAGEETYARIGMDATGNFTVTWELSDTAVYAQRFDAAGAKLGGEILVADEAAENEQDADIGVWADGSFVIAWTQGTGPSPGTYVRLYDASGNATSGAIQVAATSQSYPSVLAAPDGGFVVSWTSGTDMMLQRFDGTGSAIGDATTIGTAANLAESTLALNPNGGMGIVWDGNDADFGGVSLARYDLPDLSFITGGWGEQTDLTLSGTMADINTALEGLTYTPDTGYNGTDTLTITTDDLGNTGTGGALTDTDTVTITVGNPNAPVIDLDADNSSGQAASDFAATWTEGSGAVAIVDSDATLTDGDSNLSSITVTITNLRQAGVEYLDADTTGTSLVKNYDAGTGVLTITGSGTTADFQQVLLTVTYDNTSDAPDTTARVITFTATDALSNGNTATTTVSLSAANDAPVFIEGGVGYWQFDEGTGITTGDSAYGTSTGTLINDPTWTTGQFGQALQFNGVDDYVEIADAPELDISGAEFSASFWVKPDPGGPGTEDMFFMKGDRTGNSNVNYYLSWKSSGYITWAFKSDGYFEYLDMDVPLPTEGVWNHIAIVFNQPDVSLYINGNEYTYINVATGGTMNKPLVSNDEPLWIGAGRKDGSLVAPGENSGPFAGAIDELAIYDRALTAAEVETIRVSQPAAATADNFSIAENSANGTVVGKVAASDRDIGDTLTYTITGGNTGGAFSIDANGQIKVANSMALDFETNPTFNLTIEATDDGSPNLSDTMTVAITLNNVNDAPIARPDGVHLSFDGDDFIQVADAPSLQMTSNVTIEAWINHDDTDTGSKIIVNKEGEYEVGITAETGEIKFAFANQGTPDNWAWHNTGYFVTAGEWTHVAVTYDGVAGEAKTYINGELVDTFAQSGDLGDVYPTFNELWIGGRQNDPADRFKGQIDEVRVWSSTRTQGEIQASMGGQLTGGESGLAGNWRLDEAFGSVAIDQSASGNDGILGGSEGAAATPTYQGYSISEDSLLTVPAGTGLLANDFDADGDILTVTNVDTTGMLGSLVVNAADGSFTYDPQGVLDSLGAGERLRETFTYTANDGSVDSSPVTVTIMVVGVNDAATVSSATVALDETDAALSTSGTLTSSDVDNPDDTFAAGTTVGTIGTFSIDAAGAWNFIANSAFDSLNVGDSVSETYNVTSVDGTTSTVQITITGTDDAAVVSGTTTGAVTEANIGDAAVTATGTISISDVDADDTPSFADVAATAGDNNYGSFVLSSGTWTYTLDQSAVQDLDADDTVTDMITYTATDATTQQITITITGTDDAAVVSGTTTGAVTEANIGDAAVTATGTISIADADADDAPSFADVGATAGDNNYGSFVLSSGTWTYTLDQTAVQDLDAGDIVNDTITYTATDGTTQVVTITITGTDDAAVVSGTTTGAVTEANIGDAAVTATGTISIADADADDAPSFADVGATAGDNNYGSFVLSSGTWTYTLDQSAVQDLDADDTVTDTITYTATDATTQQITITITGTDDAAVVSGTTTGAVTEANIGDAAVTATGTISIADADADDAPSFADVSSTAGDNAYGSFVLSSGTWTYTLDQSAVQDLDADDTVTDTITYTATDATTQQITITITGTDDAAVVSGTTTGAVTEGNIGDAAVTATGTISISDVDADDTPSFADVAATAGDNNYGSFVLSSGTWTYTLDQSAVQDLDADDTVTDTITYTATDATTQQITITITGTDDAAVVSGTTTGAVTEGNIGDAAVTATGTISISDADANDSPSFADVASTSGDNAYGSFVLSSGTWTYTLDQTAVQDLDAGDIVNDTITYTATDGTTQVVTITITGTDDTPVVSGTFIGSVTEGNIGDAAVTATGTISISDADANDSPSFADVASTSGDNAYGSFVLSSGTWTYTLDQTAVQDLDAGDIVNDTITYTATDATTQQITITITGTDDAAVVSGTTTGAVTEANIGDAAVTATGTISIADADADDAPSFADVGATAGDNNYGSFVLSSGTWTYTLDQTAVQDLDAGDIVNDTITYTATDGTTQVVTITITGTDDTPVVSGTFIGSVTEGNIGDAAVTATGTISISDADANDSPSFADVASTSGDNAYGSFVLSSGTWTYTLDQTAVQDLDAGDIVNDTITYTATDATTQQITITITGTDDAAVVSGTTTGAVTEANIGDAAVTATGTISISDVDADDTPSFADVAATAGDNNYGSFVLSSGTWTYTLDQSAVQDLDADDTVTDTITYTATDATTQQITITITGTDDAAVVSGTTTGAVTEANIGDAAVTATGTISIADADTDDAPSFADVGATAGDNNYGSFVLSSGTWTYTLDQTAVQDLDAGDIVNDTITYTATDGTTQVVTITITGTDDAAVVSGTTTGAVTEGNIGDAAVTATGTISIADADADDAPSFADVGATAGDNNYGSFVLSSGTWTYTLDQTAVQDLDAGDIVNDTITYTATDGTTQVVTITITGTDDTPVVSGTFIGSVTEGNIGDAAVTATGTISISDADANDSPSFADVASTSGDNAYGSFVLSSGTWTYTLDQTAVQDLDAGDIVNDTITYTATDGTTQVVTITITGTDDAAVVSGTTTGAVTEGNIGDAAVTATGTISIADADADDAPSFADVGATAGDNNYGSFVLSSGTWTYTLDQTAVQDLDAGDIVNDTITYTATDGTTQVVTITITGTDDAAVVSGTTTGAVTEGNIGDAAVTATGTISIADADADDAPSFADVGATAGDNNYGSFVLSSGTWTYTLDQTAVQDLDAGDIVNDTITYTATDGTTQVVTITITGTDDAAVVSGTTTGAVTEGNIGDAAVTATGTISISDADANDSPSFADVASTSGDNAYGSFVLSSGTWTYTLDQTAVQDLDAGDIVNDTITYTATDGTTQVVTITITGTDDTPVVSGTFIGSVTEGNIGDAAVTATGTISISDADANDSPSFADVASTSGDNAYGSFVLSSGTWTYTLDQTAVQDLDAGDIVNDTITYTATDGTTQVVTITITGTDDAAVVSGTTTGAVTEGNIGDAAVTATGTISISDADANDSPSFADVASTSGDNAYGSFVLSSGTWTYTLDQTAVQDLDAGDIVNDTITYTATDGTTQVVTITITGTDDTPVVSGTFIGSVTEGNIGDAAVTATGTISISDADANDSPSFADVASTSGDNAYGSFVLSSGTWTYTLDQTAVQDLDAGDIVNDTITYTATDGTTQVVTITITGTDDTPVVSGTFIGSVTEGNIGDAAVTATGTISISDADANDSPSFADVASTSGDNAYGSFVLSSGTWTYTLDQTAVQDLDAGDIVNDTITYTATDATTQQITITITGTDDAAVVSGTTTGAVTEANIGDAAVTATGTISISDVDADDTPSFADVAATAGDNNYGSFVLSSGTWTYTLDQSAVQDLDADDTVTDTITYTATDATTQQITITITGTDDAAVVSGTTTGAVTEGNIGDAAVTATGTISIADADADDAPSFADVSSTAGDNNYGSFVLSSGTWTYTLDQSAVQDLDADDTVTDTITYTATDATTQQITITITGTDDAAVVSGTTTGAVTEGNIGDAAVTATGTISIADADADDAPSFADVGATAGDNNYGSFVLSSGTWTYTLDQSAVQDLDADDTVTDTITYTATDATTQQITITISGTDDAAVVSGTTTGAVTEDGNLNANGNLTITDVDTSDNPISFPDETIILADNGYGDFVLTGGTWTYSLNNAHAAVQALDVGETLTDTHTFTASDGSTQLVTMTINGAEDASVLGGVAAGAVIEDGALTGSGAITITDVDTADNPVNWVDEAVTAGDNGYGTFEISAGTWTYTLNNAHAAVQALDVGESLTDTTIFTASNGNTQLVTMTINGAEDAPIADNADSDLRGSTNPDPELFEDPEKNEDEDPGVEVPTYEDPEEDPVVVDEHALPVEKNLTLLGSADVENQLVYIEDPQVDTTEEIIYLTDEIDTDIQSKKRDDDHSYIFYDNDLYKDISPSKYLAINYTAADGPILKSGDNLSILDFDSDDPNQVEVNGDYDLHRQEIDESFDTELKSQAIQAKIVTISAASFAAGFVSYLLRAGSFVSSLMSSLPLWRGFDPIAIFSGKKKKQKDRNEIPNKNEAKSETLFDGEAE